MPGASIEKVVSLGGDKNLVSEESYATTSSEDRAEERLAGGARQTVKQREIVCGKDISSNLIPVFKEFHKMQYLKIKEE